ncbi:MAG: aminotransferase class V-fold PLP-dependent enzyme [Chloroflexi bacterium]|uniref:Aminotransferase class V-fold PLP-dependent enzyme n=1 Tax=Candidatus Chlorohelix allophototropha TaxID=3003348 RepID=A0A8T7M615_9CHLR|nr:aminotransferase class V-fold PLP-dependent enzyme [Chloroflexota bacterium]WJW69442.1 aminotransferase class V-fold PLP-dependent enzyme [Chloroflexota bacterium L227-S17]
MDAEKIEQIRANFPAVLAKAYLNTGTNGPFPECGHKATLEYAQKQYESGRIGFESFTEMFREFTLATKAVATLLGCDSEEIVLTHNTTEGMNIALMGMDWSKGDEIITATTEHPGGLYPAYLLKQRYGVKIRQTSIGKPGVNPITELKRVLNSRTKAVVLSHVSWSSGMVLPIREIADLVHQTDALLICDAAQSCGMVPSNVYELGVDAYAISGQKWLCGPDGTGALFIRKNLIGSLAQTFVGYFGIKASDYSGNFVPNDGAKRYMAATLYPPSVKAWRVTLEWLEQEVGWDWIYKRIAELGQYCYEQISELPGVSMYTPKESMAGLVHFSFEQITAPDLSTKLAEKGIQVRPTPDPVLVRASTGFYNSVEDIDRLVKGIAEVIAETATAKA